MSMTPTNSTSVLCWPKKVLSADDLRRHLTNQRELLLLPRTVITPLAVDELKAKGVHIQWQAGPGLSEAKPWDRTQSWLYVRETTDTTIDVAVAALARDGVKLTPFDIERTPWIARFAETIVEKECGGVALVSVPELVVCIGNKIAGIRAATVNNVLQVSRAQETLGANLFAIDGSGKTFFELRQMLRTITADAPKCSDDLAKTLSELDGHAHR